MTGEEEPRRSDERRIARWLALVAWLAYLPFAHGHFTGTDETGVYLTTRALYERGSLEVSEGPHRYPGRDGRTYAHFAIGLPLLALPLYAAGDAAAHVLPASWLAHVNPRPEEPGRIDTLVTPPLFAVSLYPTFATAALVAVFFGLERRLGASRRSALAAAALVGATSYVATQSVYFLRHSTEAITILASFDALLAYRQHGRLRDLVLGSAWASLTLLIAVPATVAVAPLVGYAAFRLWPRLAAASPAERVRLLAAPAAPAALAIAVHVGLNYWLWGSLLDSPMVAQRSHFSAPFYVGLWGFLLSPGCSVFVYSPLLLLLPWLLPSFWRAHRAECATVVAMSLALLFFCASFEIWPGLWSSPGPRYLFVAMPALLLPLGPWLDERRSVGLRLFTALLAVIGLGVQLVLVLSRWSEVIRSMRYQEALLASGFDFLFVPQRSPLVGSWRALAAGNVDAWLWGTLQAGSWGLALVLLAGWALALAFAARGLRRALR